MNAQTATLAAQIGIFVFFAGVFLILHFKLKADKRERSKSELYKAWERQQNPGGKSRYELWLEKSEKSAKS